MYSLFIILCLYHNYILLNMFPYYLNMHDKLSIFWIKWRGCVCLIKWGSNLFKYNILVSSTFEFSCFQFLELDNLFILFQKVVFPTKVNSYHNFHLLLFLFIVSLLLLFILFLVEADTDHFVFNILWKCVSCFNCCMISNNFKYITIL